MRKRALWVALLLGVILALLVAPAAAQAASWSDISDSQWSSQYGVSSTQVASIADGFPDGGFHPYASVTRGQFTKMADKALGVSPQTPSSPTFSDVSYGDTFYSYIEGAYASGLVQGVGDGLFGPDMAISRQQVATILARYLSAKELSTLGYIAGSTGTHYTSLSAWYAAEGTAVLASLSDSYNISTVHMPGVAYLVSRGVIQGSNGYFSPQASLTRAQAAAMIIRTAGTTFTAPVSTVPTVTSISPASGTSAGGTTVTIYGTNFTSDATVYFGTKAATSLSYYSATRLTAVSPSGTAGNSVSVRVTTDAGTSTDTSADNFTYVAPAALPTVTSISPTYGSYAGGTTVYVYGTNFTSDATVLFGSKSATSVTYYSSTQLVAVSPSGTSGSSVNVRVTTDEGTSSSTVYNYFTYSSSDVPTITSVSPDDGVAGDEVIIRGTNFPDDEDEVDVYFGTAAVDTDDITIDSSTKMTVIVPTHDAAADATVRVKVITDEGTSASTSADEFTYTDYSSSDAPSITSLTPAAGDEAGGTSVTIKGTNFGDDEDEVTVLFGDQQAEVTSVNSTGTTLKVEAPAGTAGDTVDVRVITEDGTSPNTLADDYAYGVPTITSLVPDSGDSGASIIIYGTGFSGTMDVYFDGTKVTSSRVAVNSPTKMTVKAPTGDDGDDVDVYVANDYGDSNTLTFTYDDSAPAITSISPAAGRASGSTTTVTITGTHFSKSGLEVWFGAEEVSSTYVKYVSSTKITVSRVPAGTEGETVQVKVVTDNGESPDTPADDYAYGKPVVESLSPDTGDPDGGTVVTITGTGFTPDATVKFGSTSVAAKNIEVVDPTTIHVIAPAGDDGDTVDVRVTNDYGTSAETDDDEFTYDSDINKPTITSLDPSSAAIGDTVTIEGTNFIGTLTVKFGTKTASYDWISSTEIEVTVPSGYADGKTVEVTVKNAYGLTNSTSGTDNNFTYTS